MSQMYALDHLIKIFVLYTYWLCL